MAFKPSQAKKHKSGYDVPFNMNSLMDMMTILLLFLIKLYTTSGVLVTQSASLKLPASDRELSPTKEINIAVAKDMILVNELPVMLVNDVNKQQFMIPKLETKLTEYAKKEKQLEIETGRPFSNAVIIQADKAVPFDLLFKVMYTCSKTEFYKMRLLTITASKMKIDRELDKQAGR